MSNFRLPKELRIKLKEFRKANPHYRLHSNLRILELWNHHAEQEKAKQMQARIDKLNILHKDTLDSIDK